jgi:purine/pyrimidine-nucleoside phosphorylase
MTTQQAITFSGVEITAKANVYFDGKVVSHAITLPDGSRKTLGLIFPGSFHFATSAPERMQIVAGACRARLDGTNEWKLYEAGSEFSVPASSGFDIAVESGIAEYICSFEQDARPG